MDTVTMQQLAQITGGRLVRCDAPVSVGPDVVIDSRAATPGSLFVAYAGERVDGHDYVQAACDRGAVGALVSHEVDADIAQLVVDDVTEALMCIARTAITALPQLAIVGITGSSGKTTTKDITAQLLEQEGETISPPGSFNNEIGHPLTALRCDAGTGYLVSEMGAQHVGDISLLCSITPPQVGIVLNVGHAHVGEFGSREAIAIAKGELVEALAPEGFAVLNADDALVWDMRHRTRARVVAISIENDPGTPYAVWATDLKPDVVERYSARLSWRLGDFAGSTPVHLDLPGRHIVADAVAGAAAAFCLGMSPERIAAGLDSLVPRSRWRMQLGSAPSGALVINDAYNANPESVAAGLRALENIAQSRRQSDPSTRVFAVLGDMLELGEHAEAAHRDNGIAAAFVDQLIAVGPHAASVVAGAGHGTPLADAGGVLDVLAGTLAQQDVVYLKGSHGIGLGPIGEALVEGTK